MRRWSHSRSYGDDEQCGSGVRDALIAGDPELAEERTVEHVRIAAATLRKNLGTFDVTGEDRADQPCRITRR